MKPQLVSSQTIYDGKIIKLQVDDVRLEDGKIRKREVARHAAAVCVFAYDGEYGYLVSQYRHPIGQYILEAVAGLCEKDEDPRLAAKRELNEETDALCEELEDMGIFYPSPGFTDEVIYLYSARITGFAKGTPDEDEHITVKKYPLSELYRMALNGEITDGKTVTVILKHFAAHWGEKKNEEISPCK